MRQDIRHPPGLKTEINNGTGHQIKKLLAARCIIAVLLLSILAFFYFYPLPKVRGEMLLAAALLQTLLLLVQWWITYTHVPHRVQVGFQILGDMLLVSILIFATGGLDSPFALLFGLLIIATGTQTEVMLALTVALAASGCYLGSIYMAAWYDQHTISINGSLTALMQVSAFLLVGGVMGYIARRQQRLVTEGSRVVRLHRKLRVLHDQVMETMHDGILILDGACYISDCNRAACSMLAEGADIRGELLSRTIHVPARLQGFLEKGRGRICKCEYEKKGRILFIMAMRMPEGDDEARWLLSMVDITDIRHLERKLAAQERLAAMGRMAAMLAHEIRNPLQSIGQAIDILTDGRIHQRREVSHIMREEVQRLEHLVSDMLDYAQPLHPRLGRVVVSDIIRAAIRQVDARGETGIHLDCADGEIDADADHLRLILDNLLRNAVHASPAEGSIYIYFDMVGRGQWKLEVIDAGGGVPEAMREHLFEPFVSGKSDGTGLGLATAWQVCQSNGWKIVVDNMEKKGEGKGAIFTVSGAVRTWDDGSEGEDIG